jgi:putative hydroxymethylpyrimidine transporter CytX
MTQATQVFEAYDEIRPVPPERRRLGAFDAGVLWGDLAVGLLVLVAGSLLVPALGLRTALIATAVGSVIGSALLAVTGRIGADLGVPTMVALRPALGIRGSYVASLFNIAQLIGWAGLEIIIMSQAARAISDEFFGFDGYYFWLVLSAVVATAFAIGGPVVVVRDFLQRFGIWVVLAATVWLTVRLFTEYDVHKLLDDPGAGGINFWQGVDIAIALPVSWLPLVADYSRFARRNAATSWATFVSYAIANTWFFALGAGYALVLTYDASNPNNLVGAIVDTMLPLTLGWMFLVAILADEADNAFANIYSTAVSAQNIVPVRRTVAVVCVGITAFIFAASLDLFGYETFLLFIGGAFVSLFGVLAADYFVVHARAYDLDDLYAGPASRYWSVAGLNLPGLGAWAAGFVAYIVCAQPLWVWEHAGWIDFIPRDFARFGGSIPSFVVSFAVYVALRRALSPGAAPPAVAQPRAAGVSE